MPESRKPTKIAHLDCNTVSMLVVRLRCEVGGHGERTLFPAERIERLDLRPLCQALVANRFQSLVHWVGLPSYRFQLKSSVAAIRDSMAALVPQRPQGLAPNDDTQIAVFADDVGQPLASAGRDADIVVKTFIREHAFAEQDRYLEWPGGPELEGDTVSLALLSELAALGILTCRPTLFGTTEYALQMDAFEWSGSFELTEPTLEVQRRRGVSICDMSKVEVVAELLASGWRSSRDAPESFKPGEDKVFPAAILNKSATWGQALMMSARVFDAGCPCIWHTLPSGYYLVLLKGTPSVLSALVDPRRFNQAEFLLMLKDQPF